MKFGILRHLRRTTVDLDDEKLRRVQAIFGTTSIKDTLDAALDEVLAERRRRQKEAREYLAEHFELQPFDRDELWANR
jgi:Arc/MetJ family transcription regulator